MKNVVVLGAGIQGVCCALALHDRGYRVTLIEKADKIFARTSLNQEGRIHMGFTYALDRTGRTGETMMHSALSFSAAIEEWLGKVDWNKYLLDKGYYLIHKSESLLSEDEIISYYEELQRLYSDCIDNSDLSYLGQRPKKIFEILKELPPGISGTKASCAIKTEERIIEMLTFRNLIVNNINRRGIRVYTDTEARRIVRNDTGFTVVAVVGKDKQPQSFNADLVVNCLWNNRIELDRTLGIPAPEESLYRFKIGVLGKVKRPVPNCTIISGAFGNISPRLDGSYAYIAWHQECMKGIATNGITPKEWEEFFTKDNAKELTRDWVNNSIKNISEFVPAASTFTPLRLLPGIICSAGKTDIHDRDSNVHKRADQMGIYEYGGYFSINTGKFSSAPMLAKELVQRIESRYT